MFIADADYEVELSQTVLETDLDAAISALRNRKVAFTEISEARHVQGLAKVPFVIEHLESMLEQGIAKIVVFCYHRGVLELLASKLREHHSIVTMTGADDSEWRQKAVEQFQTNPNISIFLATIAVAGAGITLTAASHVVYAEQSWSLVDMLQSEDRVHRIGQEYPVLIQNLVFNNTLDARIAKVLWKKNKNIQTILGAMT